MTKDDILRMAMEANILAPVDLLETNQWREDTIRELERFAALVASTVLAVPQVWVCPDSAEHRYEKPGHCEDCGKVLVQVTESARDGCDHCNSPLYAAIRCRVCGKTEPDDSLTAAYMLGSYDAKQTLSRSKRLAEAGFTRRPSPWALEAREALELIAAPMRPDGTWNRDREACRRLAAEVLGRPDPEC